MSRHFHASHFLLRDPAFHLKRTSHLFAEFIIFELKLFPFEKNSVLWKAPIWSLFISKELLITLMKVPWAYGFPGQIISKHIFWHQKFHVLCYWIFSAYYCPINDECQTQAAVYCLAMRNYMLRRFKWYPKTYMCEFQVWFGFTVDLKLI